jgi:hypothetical protein
VSIFTDLLDLIGSGSRASVEATQTQATNVSVNPTIINAIDTAPIGRELAPSIDRLTEVVAAGAAVQAEATREGNQQLAAAAAGRNAQLDQLAQLLSLGALAFGAFKFVGALR